MKKVLIIIDMQNDFLTGTLANPAAAALVEPIVELINSNQFDEYIFTMDTHYSYSYYDTQEGQKLPVLHCNRLSDGWNIDDRLIEAVKKYGYSTIQKYTFGFKHWRSTPALEHVDEIHVCGTCTDICVITNVALLKTYYPEVPIYVHEKLCAGLTPHTHECAIETMRSMQINIVD